jgi:hypothetical protein
MTDLNMPVGSKGYIEIHNLYLIMALLYCFDCRYFENRENSRIFFNFQFLLNLKDEILRIFI